METSKVEEKRSSSNISPSSAPLPRSWMDQIGDEFEKDYMKELRTFLRQEIEKGKVIYPHGKDIFNAFKLTPFDQVKVVIIGQDPYHGPGQAHGLCFSVRPGIKLPPSLRNIYKEITNELGIEMPVHGHLSAWAKRGVLLLNTVLTVEKSRAGSHQGKGWEHFTDAAIQALNKGSEKLVFMLWGSHAQKKGQDIDREKHLVLTSPHPSPFSAHRGFFGNNHFLKTNEYLRLNGQGEVDWSLPEGG